MVYDIAYEKELLSLSDEVDEVESNSSSIRFHNITFDDMLNGCGLRVVLWVAGCSHGCNDCQNPSTHDICGGKELTPWEEGLFWEWLDKPWTKGATFSGGDPLHPVNRDKIGSMVETIARKYGEKKDIWLYTGYTFELSDGIPYLYDERHPEQRFTLEWLKHVDVLVDGRYKSEIRKQDLQANADPKWRGSSNQRLICVKQTIANGTIVLHPDNNK